MLLIREKLAEYNSTNVKVNAVLKSNYAFLCGCNNCTFVIDFD